MAWLLRRLHRGATRLTLTELETLSQRALAHALEQDLLHAVVAYLSNGEPQARCGDRITERYSPNSRR